MTQNELLRTITAAVADILRTGNSAPKLYLRVRPNGSVDVDKEISWCCSPDEYYKRIPHTLSLEVLQGSRDYTGLDDGEIEQCANMAEEAAVDIILGWEREIDEWIAAGNLEGVAESERHVLYAE
jgi:hypothetical protein